MAPSRRNASRARRRCQRNRWRIKKLTMSSVGPALRATMLVALVLACIEDAVAATITVTIDPAEPANSGFTDPTPVSPVGDNTATTLGGQRLFVFQTAANQWGKLLQSSVTIMVKAKMTTITNGCSGTSAILGQAGPNSAFANFTNAP